MSACGGGGGGSGYSGGPITDGGVGGTSGGGQGTGGGGGGGGVGGTGVVALGTLAKAEANQIMVNSATFGTTPTTAVSIDDETATTAALEDGMLVLVEGYKNTATQASRADKISYRSNVRGPVESVSADCKIAMVLGQPVQVTAQTQPALARGACEFTLGELVDVSGLVSDEQRNAIVASFIRRMATPSTLQVSGKIAARLSDKLIVGGLEIDYESARVTPAGDALAAGSTVRVKGEVSGSGMLLAVEVEVVSSAVAGVTGTEAHLEGFITDANGAMFRVNGQLVDASSAVREPIGIVFSNGLRVELEGRFNAQGVVIADQVHAEIEESD